MKRTFVGSKGLCAALCGICTILLASSIPAQGADPAPPALDDIVYVSPPTGEQETDRAGILAALDAVEPGGTLQFAPGTYVVGRLVPISITGITLLGHPEGTTLRGCAPDAFADMDTALFACNGLELRGARQTVRDLTFEYAWHGLFVGCCFPENIAAAEAGDVGQRDQPGGHLIEGNTFRNSSNGLRVIGQSAEPVVIRGNTFRNTFHAVVVNGGAAHIVDNEVSAPEPELVPIAGHPGGAILLAPVPPAQACGSNEIAGNRIDGHTDGIKVALFAPGTRCRGTVIRNNTVVKRPLRAVRHWDGIRSGSPSGSSSDDTLTGVPIALANLTPEVGAARQEGMQAEAESVLDGAVVEGNRIVGGTGLGIEVLRSSGNRIADNTVTGIYRRDPFPGNTVNSTDPETAGWQDANGSGIWISPGSEGNQIIGNGFEDIAAHAVAVEGDNNRVEVQRSDHQVSNSGRGNRISAFADVNGVRLHYLDFGGKGLPVVFVQSFHGDAGEWVDYDAEGFAPRFADRFRVLALTRRGWGASEDTGWGYDVATQAEDLLGFMDALGLKRAVLVGRNPANQDITWLAEHHPARVAGLIYIGNPMVVADLSNPVVRTYEEMMWRMACDLGDEAVSRTGPRASWRPHFLYDEAARISIPALRIVVPGRKNRNLRHMDRMLAWATSPDPRPCNDVAQAYFKTLAGDDERQRAIRESIVAGDLDGAMDDAVQRAFGANLRTVEESPEAELEATLALWYREMRQFIEEVAAREGLVE